LAFILQAKSQLFWSSALMPNLSLINDLSSALKTREPLARKDNGVAQGQASDFNRALDNAERKAQAADLSNASRARVKEDALRARDHFENAKRAESAPRTIAPDRAEPTPHRHDKVQAERQEPRNRAEPGANSVDKIREATSVKADEKVSEETASHSDTQEACCADKTAQPVEAVIQAVQPAVVSAPALNPTLVAAQFAALLSGADGEVAVAEDGPEAALGTQAIADAETLPTTGLAVVAGSSLASPAPPADSADETAEKAAVAGVGVSSLTGKPAGQADPATSKLSQNDSSSPDNSSLLTEEKPKATSKDAFAKEVMQSTSRGAVQELANAVDQLKASTPSSVAAPAPSIVAADAAQQAKAADPAKAMMQADAPVPLQAVAVEIGMRAMRGSKEFSIRLDPEDLGRVDIRLEISEEGQVQAKLVVDRVETLQLLQRDAKTLERAFEQAGLKTNPDGLQFSLRDPGQQNRNANRDQHADRNPSGDGNSAVSSVDDIVLRPAIFRKPATSGLDIRI
jgi:flagellar hook-length control protein FliK